MDCDAVQQMGRRLVQREESLLDYLRTGRMGGRVVSLYAGAWAWAGGCDGMESMRRAFCLFVTSANSATEIHDGYKPTWIENEWL